MGFVDSRERFEKTISFEDTGCSKNFLREDERQFLSRTPDVLSIFYANMSGILLQYRVQSEYMRWASRRSPVHQFGDNSRKRIIVEIAGTFTTIGEMNRHAVVYV